MGSFMSFLPMITGGISAYSQISAAKSQNSLLQAQADTTMRVAEQNAKISKAQAADAIKRGGAEEEKMRRQFEILRGRQMVQAAASGVDAETGSPLEIQKASLKEEERDVATNALNYAREAWGYNMDAYNALTEGASRAAALRSQGHSGLVGAYSGAGSSLLSLAGQMYSSGQSQAPSNAIKVDPNQYAAPAGPGRGVFDALSVAAYTPKR
jgi:hypothetical protein